MHAHDLIAPTQNKDSGKMLSGTTDIDLTPVPRITVTRAYTQPNPESTV